MKAERYSITYRIPLTDAQQAKLDRKWPDDDPFISYEKIEFLLEPLPVELLFPIRTTHLAERKKMMQLWADYLDVLKAGASDLIRYRLFCLIMVFTCNKCLERL